MMNQMNIVVMTDQNVRDLQGSRVVSLRWDVVPWALVIDVDAPVAETSFLRRAWMVFDGFSEITCSFEQARVPNGLWISSPTCCEEDGKDGFRNYSFSALLPRHNQTDAVLGSPARSVTIRAQGLHGFSSASSLPGGEFRGLGWAERMSLASDHDLVAAVARKLNDGAT
jgi:hypothetical protein